MTKILVKPKKQAQVAPIPLTLHLTTTFNITAKEARQYVNRQIIPELGTGLVATEPELLLEDEDLIWRVPLILSLPNLGNLGQVGIISMRCSYRRNPIRSSGKRKDYQACSLTLSRCHIIHKVVMGPVYQLVCGWF